MPVVIIVTAGIAFAAVRGDPGTLVSSCSDTPEVQGTKSSSTDSIKDYKSFMSQGFVLLDNSSTTHSVKNLRDTGAAQTLLLEGVLPVFEQTFAAKTVLIQDVELGFINVPLHRICLKSDLNTGPVTVGGRPTLPVPDVSFLIGNDLAGGKLNPILQSVRRLRPMSNQMMEMMIYIQPVPLQER